MVTKSGYTVGQAFYYDKKSARERAMELRMKNYKSFYRKSKLKGFGVGYKVFYKR
jgi:hypothetical protein